MIIDFFFLREGFSFSGVGDWVHGGDIDKGWISRKREEEDSEEEGKDEDKGMMMIISLSFGIRD